jgi:putative aldouronate transport system substrate-binding protein
MIMRKRRLPCIALLLALSLGFSACGGGAGSATTTGAPASGAATATETATETAVATDASGGAAGDTSTAGAGRADGSNATGAEEPAGLPYAGSTVSVMASEHPSQTFSNTAPSLEWIKEATGITIDLQTVPAADYATKTNTLFATNNLPDIVKGASAGDYFKDELFVDILEYPELVADYLALIGTVEALQRILYFEGRMYGFTEFPYYTNATGPLPMIRGDILAETGYGVPTTYDELKQVLLKMKELYPESYPWASRGINTNAAYGMGSGIAWGNQHGMYYDDDLGMWIHGPSHENFVIFLEYMSELFKAGVLDPEYGNSNAEWQEKLSTDHSFFMYDNASFTINMNAAIQAVDPDARFIPVPPMTNSLGQKRNLLFSSYGGINTVISADSPNIEPALYFMNWLYTEEGRLTTNFGIEGVQYAMVDGEPTLTEAEVESANAMSDPWRGFMGKYGIGSLGMANCIDGRNQWPFMDESAKEWYLAWPEMDGIRPTTISPVFSSDESEELVDLAAAVQTLYASEIDKYYTGAASLDSYPAFQRQLKDAGATRIQEIYNEAFEREK